METKVNPDFHHILIVEQRTLEYAGLRAVARRQSATACVACPSDWCAAARFAKSTATNAALPGSSAVSAAL